MYVGKKAQNVIEYPVHPFIQKDPPRFYNTGKHWTVHTDDVIRGQADNTQVFDGSILAVSRMENQTRYGKNSYIPKVNKEVRYPLIYREDIEPLCRIIRPQTQLRINPDSGSLAQTQNIHGIDVSSFIDERVMKGSVRPSFRMDLPTPITEQCGNIPELKFNRPQVAGYSNTNTPMTTPLHDIISSELYESVEPNRPYVYGNSGVNTFVTSTMSDAVPTFELESKGPSVSAGAAMNTPIQLSSRIENFELHSKNPSVSVSSGYETDVSFMNETPVQELQYNRPQTSARLNPTTTFSKDAPTQIGPIKTQTPITLNYETTKNSLTTRGNANKNPKIRDTLQYQRDVSSTRTIPYTLQHQNIKLRPKIK